MRAATDAALDRLAVGPAVRRAREHRVLGGDPASPEPFRQRGTPARERRDAEHPGAAELDEDASRGVVEPARVRVTGRSWSGGAAVGAGHAGPYRSQHGRPPGGGQRLAPRPATGRRASSSRPGARTAGRQIVDLARRGRRRSGRRTPRAPRPRPSGSFQGGMCVSTSRADARPRGRRARLAGPVRWMSRRVVAALDERRLGQQQVGARGEVVQRRRTGRCRRCRRVTCGRRRSTREPNAGIGCSTGTGVERERPQRDRPPVVLVEVELGGHAGVERHAVGARRTAGRAPGGP